MNTVECPDVDVMVPTVDNPTWLQRCLLTLLRNTEGLGNTMPIGPNPIDLGAVFNVGRKITPIILKDRKPWKDAVRDALDAVQTPLVLHVQDDCLILPGNPQWLQQMAWPFSVDPLVAVVACTVTNASNSNQSFKLALPPGYYLTTSIIPVIFLARVDRLREAMPKITDDALADQEFSLSFLEAGYKLVIATHVAHHHEGMQTNPRIYGATWVQEAARRIKEEIPKRHPAGWLARLDACEMVPFVNYYVPREGGVEVRQT